MRKPRGKYTGKKIEYRKKRQSNRQAHKVAVENEELQEELPEPLFPEVFRDIQEAYWHALKSIPDPRSPGRRVYPLHLILHRIIAGFLGGNKFIGVLFPKKRLTVKQGRKQLGSVPTRKTVYTLLRRINWPEANLILSPLWNRLGHTPDLTVKRNLRNPKEIQSEAEEKRRLEEQHRRKELHNKREAEEKSKGMSAAKAKRPQRKAAPPVEPPKKTEKTIAAPQPLKIQRDLVIDGKVVKASYNNGVGERFVHVTEIKVDKESNRSRFIIGVRPTELDRHGEWGAAMSVLEALTPLSNDVAVVISGDAGFNVESFCEWLTENGFFLRVQDKGKRW